MDEISDFEIYFKAFHVRTSQKRQTRQNTQRYMSSEARLNGKITNRIRHSTLLKYSSKKGKGKQLSLPVDSD